MNANNLNLRQKKLIQQLAELKDKGQLIEPINPFPLGLMSYVIYLRSQYNLRFESISDLEVLTLAGYLDFQWNRSGVTKLYAVTALGMAILEDPKFITKVDYERYKQLQDSLEIEIFDDSAETATLDQSIQSLLSAEFSYLTHVLQQLTAEILPEPEQHQIMGIINQAEVNLKSGGCTLPELQGAIETIGQHILGAVREAGDTGQAQSAAHALLVFSLWNQQISKQLAKI